MITRKKIDDVAGKICKTILPIRDEQYHGQGKELAICTLASIDLLQEISKSILMKKIAIAGRLLSENKGIDKIISFALDHPKLNRIIVCGQEVKGHRAGQALLMLYKNGVDENGRIIGATGSYPVINSSNLDIQSFRKQVIVDDMIGTTDIKMLIALIS